LPHRKWNSALLMVRWNSLAAITSRKNASVSSSTE
jgi:hypothetical protein